MMTPEHIKQDPHWKAMRGVITADLGITQQQVDQMAKQYRDKYGPVKDLESHIRNYLVREARDLL